MPELYEDVPEDELERREREMIDFSYARETIKPAQVTPRYKTNVNKSKDNDYVR